MNTVKNTTIYFLLVLCSLALLGCSQNADEDKPISDVKTIATVNKVSAPTWRQSHARDDSLDLLGYFADMHGGNKDGKFTIKEVAALNDHHLGGVVTVYFLNGSKEFVDEVLEQSRHLAKGGEYKRAYEDQEVGLAIVSKARQLGCLDALKRLKGAEWLSDPDKLARTDMADLGGAFLAGHYSWKTDDIRKVLEQEKHGREGFRIFIVALMSGWSPPNIHNRPSYPELKLEEKVIKKVKEISNGEFSPQVIGSLPDRIPGKTFAEKVDFLLDNQ